MTQQDPIKVGGRYVENENHVPNPTDMVKQFNTSGTGAHGRIEETSHVFETDRVKVAQEVTAALDPKNTLVSSDRVLLPETAVDNETAKKDLLAVSKERLKQGVVVGGPTPAEREAAREGNDGTDAAVEQERQNAASNSTGQRDAGRHSPDVANGRESASTASGTGDPQQSSTASGTGDDTKQQSSSTGDNGSGTSSTSGTSDPNTESAPSTSGSGARPSTGGSQSGSGSSGSGSQSGSGSGSKQSGSGSNK